MARTRLLDVFGHEPGPTRCRDALRVNLESKLRGPPGPRGRTHLVSPAVAAASAVMVDSLHQKNCREARSRRRGPRRSARALGRRHDQIIPSDWLKRVERTDSVEDCSASGATTQFRSQSTGLRGRERLDRGSALRHRILARTRGLGPDGLRIRGHHRALLR